MLHDCIPRESEFSIALSSGKSVQHMSKFHPALNSRETKLRKIVRAVFRSCNVKKKIFNAYIINSRWGCIPLTIKGRATRTRLNSLLVASSELGAPIVRGVTFELIHQSEHIRAITQTRDRVPPPRPRSFTPRPDVSLFLFGFVFFSSFPFYVFRGGSTRFSRARSASQEKQTPEALRVINLRPRTATTKTFVRPDIFFFN